MTGILYWYVMLDGKSNRTQALELGVSERQYYRLRAKERREREEYERQGKDPRILILVDTDADRSRERDWYDLRSDICSRDDIGGCVRISNYRGTRYLYHTLGTGRRVEEKPKKDPARFKPRSKKKKGICL